MNNCVSELRVMTVIGVSHWDDFLTDFIDFILSFYAYSRILYLVEHTVYLTSLLVLLSDNSR